MDELETKPIEAPLHTYHSGGYVKLLSYEAHQSLAIIRRLRSIKWLDRASRLVLLELNMINLNMDLILSTKWATPTPIVNHSCTNDPQISD